MEVDMSSWLGKPPEKSNNTEDDTEEDAEKTSSHHSQSPASNAHSSSDSDDDGDIEHSPANNIQVTVSDVESVRSPAPRLQQDFYIDVPRLSKEEKDEYEYLPGHFSVRRVLSKLEDGRYLIKRKSGDRDLVSALLHFLVVHFCLTWPSLPDFTFPPLYYTTSATNTTTSLLPCSSPHLHRLIITLPSNHH